MIDQATAAPLSGVTQFQPGDGIIDLGPGQPDPALLPIPLFRTSLEAGLEECHAGALCYGANAGPWPSRQALAAWSARTEQIDCGAEHVLVTAGASHALDLLCTRLGGDGAVVLVQKTSYNLALDLFRARRLEPVGIGTDLSVPTAGDFEKAIRETHAAGKRIAFAYLIPTYHNPTGVTLSLAQRESLLTAASEAGVVIVEDDPCRLLHFGAPPPPSLVAISGGRGVIGVRTLSKLLGPGARVGFLLSEPALVRTLSEDPLFTSGGGIAHLAALAIPRIVGGDAFGAHIARLRESYRRRRDALLGVLALASPAGVTWREPQGGFFAWVSLPPDLSAAKLTDRAACLRIRFLPGSRSFAAATAEGDSFLRLAFSRYPEDVLAAAGEQLALALHNAHQ
jgi:2-aminoadipate transaminase